MRTCRTFCEWTRLHIPLRMRALVARNYLSVQLHGELGLFGVCPRSVVLEATPAVWWKVFGLEMLQYSPGTFSVFVGTFNRPLLTEVLATAATLMNTQRPFPQ